MKLKNIFFLQNSKTQILTQLKNSNCDKTKIVRRRKNSITQNVTKLKLGQSSRTQIVTKFKSSNCDKTQKTQIVTKLEL